MKIREKAKIPTIDIQPRDGIQLTYTDPWGKERVVLKRNRVGRKIKVNEAVIFDVERGDFAKDVIDGIGGAFLSTENENKKSQSEK